MSDNQNVFWIARNHDADEDQLTELLCWLISVVPEVGSIVIQLALPGADPEPVHASTQQVIPGGRLDLLLKRADTLVVVESKLTAEYGPHQLRKYAEWLATKAEPPTRVVLALTKRTMPWPEADAARALELSIGHEAARWEDLYTHLQSLRAELTGISERLVGEFCETLEEEGLIPVKPLEADELANAWRNAYTTISHYHEFFRACVEKIAEAMDAEVIAGKSESMWWTYRTLEQSGQRFWLGISCEGRNYRPFVWISLDAEWQDIDSAVKQWMTKLPAGWSVDAGEGFYGRPLIACDLGAIITAEAFEVQSEQLATATAAALAAWLK